MSINLDANSGASSVPQEPDDAQMTEEEALRRQVAYLTAEIQQLKQAMAVHVGNEMRLASDNHELGSIQTKLVRRIERQEKPAFCPLLIDALYRVFHPNLSKRQRDERMNRMTDRSDFITASLSRASSVLGSGDSIYSSSISTQSTRTRRRRNSAHSSVFTLGAPSIDSHPSATAFANEIRGRAQADPDVVNI